MKEFQLQFIVNKQTRRVLKLLDTFERTSAHTLKELETTLSVSDRTILTDIHFIKDYFEEIVILESSLIGYTFTILDRSQYTQSKQLLIEDEPLFKIIEQIFFNECLTLIEWSEELLLSESSILRYLKTIEPILSEYGIMISKNRVDFVGNEINIRRFFYDFYYESSITSHTVFPPLSIHNITLALRQENFFDEYTHITFGDFNYTIYIAIERFLNGKTIQELPKELDFLKKNLKPSYYSNVKKIVVDYFGIDLSDIEKLYIYTVLLCKRSLMDFNAEMKFLEKVPQSRLAVMWAEKYAQLIETPYKEKARTLVFLESFFTSIYLKSLLSPTLNQNVHDVNQFTTERFSMLFDKTYAFISQNLKEPLHLTDTQVQDISANLTIYTDSLTLMYWKTYKNVAFLLEGNRYVCGNIRAIAIKSIGNYHNLFFPDAADMSMTYFDDNNIDIIVTNYNEYIADYIEDREYILFEVNPTTKDWKKLFTLINPRYTYLFGLNNDK
ncbi:helix-turn-helix domain-containing protein [Marinilactibacillus kalidii]|uniref:helix-turn-helix domain-containing protein n=1 Tax=Marinilactibacillus kalidii TaxID=2820274 RepID=UPI001ABDE58F|nr:helix-turn-helix domain-containing protein [Marinilactibacillus kalidii]